MKGKYPVVFKSEDRKIWKETFPKGKINMYPLFFETFYSSLEINSNTVWVTEIVPAPGELDGEIVGIFYSHDLGVTWNAIPYELCSLQPMITFDKNGYGRLVDDRGGNDVRYYHKMPESDEWILDNNINTDVMTNEICE
jgi:hypothetical protein